MKRRSNSNANGASITCRESPASARGARVSLGDSRPPAKRPAVGDLVEADERNIMRRWLQW